MTQTISPAGACSFPGESERFECLRLTQTDGSTGPVPYIWQSWRKLGALSDFTVNELGTWNDGVRVGTVAPTDLWRKIDDLLALVPGDQVNDILRDRARGGAASVDLAFAERSVAIAFKSSPAYRELRNGSTLLRLSKKVAEAIGRQPFLSWADIATGHPVQDPRSFLRVGRARDQEIHMYRVQPGPRLEGGPHGLGRAHSAWRMQVAKASAAFATNSS